MKVPMKIISAVLVAFLSTSVMAQGLHSNQAAEREQVIREYVLDLGRGDADAISSLFEEGGTVISTSKGKVDAKEFFHGFLPEIDAATTEVHQLFNNTVDDNRFAARFYFKFHLKDGDEGSGEYIDEFIFSDNSNKLSAVYMFENLKFGDASNLAK